MQFCRLAECGPRSRVQLWTLSESCAAQLAHVARAKDELQEQVDQLGGELARSSAALADLRAAKSELQCVAAAAALRTDNRAANQPGAVGGLLRYCAGLG